ncbi:MAG: single-stranded DNA-binding protein [Ottowia sp.]|nr:single-stranded DNA-binding protein [Ottowia sp.]
MIDCLIQGKLFAAPQQRTSKAGKPFATAKLIAAAGDGESLFLNVIAFDAAAVSALLALAAGDSVALAGTATPRAYIKDGEPRASLDVMAQQVLTAYHVTRKRRASE